VLGELLRCVPFSCSSRDEQLKMAITAGYSRLACSQFV